MKSFMGVTFLLLGSIAANKLHAQAYGALTWQKCLGGTSTDYLHSITSTSDTGYIAVGYTYSTDGDVSGFHGGYGDGWVVKLSATGTIQWQKCLGGTNGDDLISIVSTTDGGYVAAGYTYSTDGDVSGNHGQGDGWVVKLSATGTIQWQKCLGGTKSDHINSITATSDGGYIAAGYTYSTDGDVSGNHGKSDGWIVKLSATGTIQWQKCLGGTDEDNFFSVIPTSDIVSAIPTSDTGYIAVGYTYSTDGDVSGNHGYRDGWMVKLSNTGTIQWQKCLGGTDEDYTSSIIATPSGGYMVAGHTVSNDGDVSGNHGIYDFWVVKLEEKYMMPKPPRFPPGPYYYPFTVYPTIIGSELDCITIQATDEEMSSLPATVTINQLVFPFKTVLTQPITSQHKCVDASKLRAGTYILTVTGLKGEVYKTKIIKE